MRLRYSVVDDAPFIRELLKSVMNSMGHLCVGEAGDAREALDLVAQTLPDLIFVDLVMPGKNGVTLSKEIKELWPDGVLVACTTLEPSDLPTPADAKVFSGWLGKPFTKEQIQQIIQSTFSGKKEAKT